MTITGRQARAMLRGAGLGDRQARQVLASVLAGEPERVGPVLGYEEERVRALAERPVLRGGDLLERCPTGWFIGRRRDAVTLPDRATQLQALSVGWVRLPLLMKVELAAYVAAYGPLPFVATVGGFVYLGADLVDIAHGRLVLGDPGPWFDQVRDTRTCRGPGRPWHVRLIYPGDHLGDVAA